MAKKKNTVKPVSSNSAQLIKDNYIKIFDNGRRIYYASFTENKNFVQRLEYIRSFAEKEMFLWEAFLNHTEYKGLLDMETFTSIIENLKTQPNGWVFL